MEPLRTDEPLAPGERRKSHDLDAMMLAGCSAFLIVSVTVYALAVWPHFIYPATERLATLLKCLGLGLGPALVVGIVGARKAGVAGACGFVAGALSGSVFLFLRLQQVFVPIGTSTGHDPNYPDSLLYFVPGGWFVLAVVVALVATPRPKFRGLGADNDRL